MTTQTTLNCNGKAIRLKAIQLIKRGGEGAVYASDRVAIKLYDKPSPERQRRLIAWLDWLAQHPLPANFVVPDALVTDEKQQVAGYRMPLLPASALPLKSLTQPNIARNPGWKLDKTVTLLAQMANDLKRLHRMGVVVGDLSDHNLHVDLTTPQPRLYWIDTDSYQFDQFCGEVMQPAFAAPWINSAARPTFSEESDWYAFHVIMFKLLLWVHPYGGVHKTVKSLLARQQQGIWALAKEVIYPRLGQPAGLLSPPLFHYLEHLFARSPAASQYRPVPDGLLRTYALGLAPCPSCQAMYHRDQQHCPYCQSQFAQKQQGTRLNRRWLIPPGQAQSVVTVRLEPQTGRLRLVTYCDGYYQLHTGGVGGHFQTLPLFKGHAGYQFSLFDHHILVQPATASRRLLFSIQGDRPRLLEKLEFAPQTQAASTATPAAFYRRVGDCLNRGREQHGLYVEELAFPVRPAHLTLWPAGHADQIVGLEQQFRNHCFFVWRRERETGRSTYHELQRPTHSLRAEMAIHQDGSTILLIHRQLEQQHSLLTGEIYTVQGALRQQWAQPEPLSGTMAPLTHGCWHQESFWLPAEGQLHQMGPRTDTTIELETELVAPDAQLLSHPAGLLVRHQDALAFLTT